jgi:RHS repeat-associated protein
MFIKGIFPVFRVCQFLSFVFLLCVFNVKAETIYLEPPDIHISALVEFYDSTDGQNWDDNANWLSEISVCSWRWVSCQNELISDNEGDRVFQKNITRINVWSGNLNGPIPTTIGGINTLEYLALPGATGVIPDSIGSLSNLTDLYLPSVSGDIPETLGNLLKLTQLNLGGAGANGLTGNIPSVLGNLTELRYLYLDKNQLTGSIPDTFGNLIQLIQLDLNGNQLTGSIPDTLGNLTQLTRLYLNTNQLTGSIPDSIGNLFRLKNLRLNSNQLTGALPNPIVNLTELEELNLSSNKLIGSILEHIGNLTELRSFNLSFNNLTGPIPVSIGNLTKMYEMYLRVNNLSGEVPKELLQFIETQNNGYFSNTVWNNPELGGPLVDSFTELYPKITEQLKLYPNRIRDLGMKNCYLDTKEFINAFESTNWLEQACGVEAQVCPEKNTGPECLEGNPINARTGVKQESAIDYVASGQSPLKIKRNYNSSKRAWQFNTANQSLIVSGDFIKLKGRSKSNYLFSCSSTTPSLCSARMLVGQSHTYQGYRLNKLTNGYSLTLPSGAIETYNTTGQLTATSNAQGRILTYSVQGTTTTVTDEFSQQITLTTNADNRVIQAVTPIGTFTYSYDDFNRLTTVTKPDTTTIGYRYDEVGYSTTQYYESSEQSCSGDDYLTVEACTPLVRKLGLLTGKIDEKGQRYASWYYDEQQRAYKSEHGSGIDATEIQFISEQGQSSTDAQGATVALQRVRDTISPLGLRTRTTFRAPYGQRAEKIETFDASDNLVSTETYTYDSNGYEAEHVDINGLKTTYNRYNDGRETSRTENADTANARTINTSYSGNTNKPTQITTPETRVNITYISHNSGLLISKQTTTDLSTNKQRITNFSYNAQGQLVFTDGPRTDIPNTDDITTFEYNAQGLKTKTTNALGQVTEVTSFNAHGKPLALVDENSITTTLTYDLMGRVTKIERAGTTQLFDYDLNGTLKKSTLANGSIIHYEYDVAQRLTAIEDSEGNRIEYSLDDAGNQLSTQVKNNADMLLRSQQQLFDEFSRLVTITNGTSNSTQLDYLTNGNLDKSTDALSNPTSNSYDALQRLKDIHDPEGGKTTFGYDNAGRTTSITDATNKATTYTYNGFGELVKQVSPDSGETTFTYDKAGNLISETDARGITVNYQYDALNRLTKTTYPDSVENITFTYDNTANDNKGLGRLTGVSEAAGSRSYIYGELGQLLTENYTIGAQSYSLSYQYDAAGQLTSITYPSGRTVTYTLNTDGQITAMATLASGQSQTNQSLLSNASYLPFGPLQGFTFGNGLANNYSYDNNYRLTAHTLTGLKNETLSYTDVGNINVISDSVNATNNMTFGYDKLSRLLTSADNNSADTSGDFIFTYDDIGNRQTKLNNNTAENYDYVANTHHLDKVTVDKEVQVPSYASSFNQARRMASAANVSYQYNYRQLRVSKSTTVNEQTTDTHYHYDGNGLLIAESDHNGVWQKEYVYFNGQLITMVDYSNGVAQPAYAVHTDHLGTPTQITNTVGTLVWQATYSPFGLATINNDVDGDNNKVELNIRFPGQYYDKETELHYNWHRYYDPKVGRYITSDPLGLSAGINTYGYVEQNPIVNIDPKGLETFQCKRPLDSPPSQISKTQENLAFYHQYSCVILKNGVEICDGQTASGSLMYSPGKPSGWMSGEITNDKLEAEACEQVRDEDTCFEMCMMDAWVNFRPTYGVGPQATDCQEYDDSIHKQCRNQCPIINE